MATFSLPSTCNFRSGAPTKSVSSLICRPSSLGSVKHVSQAFGLKASSSFRVSAMAVYKVKLIGPDGEENELEAPDDCCILDTAENAGLELPCSCRAGFCWTCTAKIVQGSVDQSDGCFLDDKMADGFILLCISRPTSDCVIQTHREVDLY